MPAELIQIRYCPDSAQYFEALSGLESSLWLDSAGALNMDGRYDILSAMPVRKLIKKGLCTSVLCIDDTGHNYVNGYVSSHDSGPSVYVLMRDMLQEFSGETSSLLDHLPFYSGFCGYWGYDLSSQKPALSEDSLPDMQLGFYLWSLVVDHKEKTAVLAFSPSCSAVCRSAVKRCMLGFREGFVTSRESHPEIKVKPFKINTFKASLNVDYYHECIARIKRYILDGDCYQVNFAQRFDAMFSGDTIAAYLHLRKKLPSPYSAYIPIDQGAIICLSPERLIKSNGSQVSTKPIKGTLARGSTAEIDMVNADTLRASKKDRAENLMIVDLLRNDLSRVCRYGSVKTEKLFELESYANVHHLVSTITGIIDEDCDAIDLMSAVFPGGSITGAPKIRAMEIIEELEVCARTTYCGSIGYIGVNGKMELNIAIRTLVAHRKTLHCWGGGGIVADSDADMEYQESLDKVNILMRSLEDEFAC